jgi:hypothetical protein
MQEKIAQRCISSLNWQLENCRFANGAVGMFGRDDEWLGMTAGVVLNYLELKGRKLLDVDSEAGIQSNIEKSIEWLIENATPEFAIGQMGYRKREGFSAPNHKENAGWLVAWCVEALAALAENR